MFRLTLFIVLSLLALSNASADLESIRSQFQQNQCLKENLISPLSSFSSRIFELSSFEFSNSTETFDERVQIAKELAALFSRIKEIKFECKLDEIAASLHDDWLQSAGYLFLVASNCFKDVGADLLILDSAIKSFQGKNYTDGLFNVLALGLLGYQSYNDCKPLVEFFKVDHQFSLGEPNNLGGCSVWNIAGCGVAVGAAGVTCGETGPGTVACIMAALSAIPGCGQCLCQQLNCPHWCPC